MLKNLKSLIIEEVKMIEEEKYKSNDKKLKEKLSIISEETNNLKYNYRGDNKMKVFFYDIFNHGMSKYHSSFLPAFSGLSFALISLFFLISIVGFKTMSQSQPIAVYILSSILILGFFLCVILTCLLICQLYLDLPDKIQEYRIIEETKTEISFNRMNWEKSLKNSEKLFEDNNFFESYNKITVSKAVLFEVIKSLNESDVKELLGLEAGKQIYYGNLIKKIKRIDREKELSDVYDNLKSNNDF